MGFFPALRFWARTWWGYGQQPLDWPAPQTTPALSGVRKAVSGSCHPCALKPIYGHWEEARNLLWKLQQSAFEKLLSIFAPSPGHRAERQCKLQHGERAKGEQNHSLFKNVTEILLHGPVPWASPGTLVQLQIPLNELESWIEPRNLFFSLQVNLYTLNFEKHFSKIQIILIFSNFWISKAKKKNLFKN